MAMWVNFVAGTVFLTEHHIPFDSLVMDGLNIYFRVK